jgi:hypothetical protein
LFVRAFLNLLSIFAGNKIFFSVSYFSGAASFTIYSRTKEYGAEHQLLCRPRLLDAALTGGISGAMSGSLISFGSARKLFPYVVFSMHLLTLHQIAFELVKVNLILLRSA